MISCDFNKILKSAEKNPKHWLIIKTFYETGMSVSELISITTTMRYLHSIHSEREVEEARKILRKMNK